MHTDGICRYASEYSNFAALSRHSKSIHLYTTKTDARREAVLLYDWLLTLDDEVALIWNFGHRPRITLSILYAVSRYGVILYELSIVLTNMTMSLSVCSLSLSLSTAHMLMY